MNDGARIFTRHGRLRAVGHDVGAVLAARAFNRHVHVAGRDREALRVDQEVLDQRFHLRVDLVLGRRHDARVVAGPGAGRRDALNRLPGDLDALAHLRDAHAIPRVDVALGRRRHFEVVGLVAEVREVLPDVVVRPAGARDRTDQAPLHRIVLRDDATPSVRRRKMSFFVSSPSNSSIFPGNRSRKAFTASWKPRGRSSRSPPMRM